METFGVKVLLIEPFKERNIILSRILIELNFQVVSVRNVEMAVKKWLEHTPHIVICQKDMREYSGFHFYSMLKDDFLKMGIPFILLMNQFNKEDLLVGMELGIDSFIFPPYDKDKIANILEKQLQKSKERNQISGTQFKSFFEVTPFGVFVARNQRIIEGNNSFFKLIGQDAARNMPLIINDIFNFQIDKTNDLKLLRCLNGIIKYCHFKNIGLLSEQNTELVFDIYLSFAESGLPSAKTIGLVIPVTDKVDRSMQKRALEGNRNLVNEKLDSVHNSENNIDFFTNREKQILKLSATGTPIKQIASQLGISVRTVEKHRSNIIRKTNAGNIIEAVFYVKQRQLLELS